jgi:antitoxin ParD1/3/4
MRQLEVLLSDELNDFVETNLARGYYASSSEVISDALRLLETQQSAKLKWLQEAYRIGVESGDAGEVDIEELIAEAHAQRAAAGKS